VLADLGSAGSAEPQKCLNFKWNIWIQVGLTGTSGTNRVIWKLQVRVVYLNQETKIDQVEILDQVGQILINNGSSGQSTVPSGPSRSK
jgi:hypothetical protein